MWCAKCGGRIFIDRVFSQYLSVEVFCIACGKRWMLHKERTAIGRWLSQIEEKHAKNFSTSS